MKISRIFKTIFLLDFLGGLNIAIKEMFKSISAVGNDVLSRSSFQVGSLLVESMTVGGD